MRHLRWAALVLLAGWSLSLSAAAPVVPPDIEELFATIRNDNVFIYAVPGSNHVGNVIETLIQDGKKPQAIAGHLERKFSLSPAAAHAVVRAWATTAIAISLGDGESADRAARAKEAVALWRRACELAPVDAVALEAVEALASLEVEGRDDSIRAILRAAPDSHSVATAALNATYDKETSGLLFEAAVAGGRSEDPLLLLAAAQKYYRRAFALAAFERRQVRDVLRRVDHPGRRGPHRHEGGRGRERIVAGKRLSPREKERQVDADGDRRLDQLRVG